MSSGLILLLLQLGQRSLLRFRQNPGRAANIPDNSALSQTLSFRYQTPDRCTNLMASTASDIVLTRVETAALPETWSRHSPYSGDLQEFRKCTSQHLQTLRTLHSHLTSQSTLLLLLILHCKPINIIWAIKLL